MFQDIVDMDRKLVEWQELAKQLPSTKAVSSANRADGRGYKILNLYTFNKSSGLTNDFTGTAPVRYPGEVAAGAPPVNDNDHSDEEPDTDDYDYTDDEDTDDYPYDDGEYHKLLEYLGKKQASGNFPLDDNAKQDSLDDGNYSDNADSDDNGSHEGKGDARNKEVVGAEPADASSVTPPGDVELDDNDDMLVGTLGKEFFSWRNMDNSILDNPNGRPEEDISRLRQVWYRIYLQKAAERRKNEEKIRHIEGSHNPSPKQSSGDSTTWEDHDEDDNYIDEDDIERFFCRNSSDDDDDDDYDNPMHGEYEEDNKQDSEDDYDNLFEGPGGDNEDSDEEETRLFGKPSSSFATQTKPVVNISQECSSTTDGNTNTAARASKAFPFDNNKMAPFDDPMYKELVTLGTLAGSRELALHFRYKSKEVYEKNGRVHVYNSMEIIVESLGMKMIEDGTPEVHRRKLQLTGQKVELQTLGLLPHPPCIMKFCQGPEPDWLCHVSKVKTEDIDWFEEGKLAAKSNNIRWIVVPPGIREQPWFQTFLMSINESDRETMETSSIHYQDRKECWNCITLLDGADSWSEVCKSYARQMQSSSASGAKNYNTCNNATSRNPGETETLKRGNNSCRPEPEPEPEPETETETDYSNQTSSHCELLEKDEEPEFPSVNELTSLGVNPKVANVLHPYQRAGVKFLLDRSGCGLLADDMGLGKTIQATAAMSAYLDISWGAGPGLKPLLVIGPKSALDVWKSELMKWLGLNERQINILTTGNKKVINHISTCVVICSIDLIPNLVKETAKNKIKPGDSRAIIVDECHSLKNMTAARTEAVLPLLQGADRCLLLSGTPALNEPKELWPQVSVLCPKLGIPMSKDEYMNKYVKGRLWGFESTRLEGARYVCTSFAISQVYSLLLRLMHLYIFQQ